MRDLHHESPPPSSQQPLVSKEKHPTSAWLRQVRVYQTTSRVLVSYGWFQVVKRLRGASWADAALPKINRRNARRLKEMILQVRGLFIKVGQLVSLLANFLPADFRSELEELQDRVPPRPWQGVRRHLEAEWGQAPEVKLSAIDSEALAAASLAQVHGAVLEDGSKVAVKVQHENIESLARLDLATIRRVIKVAGFFTGIRGLDSLLDEITSMIHEELDFRREADHIQQIGAQLEGLPKIEAVEVVPELSTSRVLVTRFVEGVKITDLAALDARGIDRQALAARVLDAYCRMILIDGVYHADPHPGNLLVSDDGTVVFIDFGAVGRVSRVMKEGLPKLLEALLRRDRQEVLRALRSMGFVQRQGGDEVAQQMIDYLYSRFLEDLEFESWNLKDVHFDLDMKTEMFADLRRLDLALGELTAAFQIPQEWILLARTHILLLGVCTTVDPDMRPVKTLEPFLEELLLNQKSSWLGIARSVVQDFSLAAVSLPGDLKRVLQRAERGEMTIEVRGLTEGVSLLYALGHQFLLTAFALTTGAFAYLAHKQGDPNLSQALCWTSGGALALLASSLWKARRWQRRIRRGAGRS
ncbi:MAG: hypothetical protein K0U98_13595 [Deltaproteobacteria bacterium]|nr:hypothetical protein [Deltaproteobacteria bacterium]